MSGNIVLIGFMGAGKSSVGRALAAKLRMKFVELDSLVEQKAGKCIADIFKCEGEPVFRSLESTVAADASLTGGAVISCGGGIVLNPVNIERLKKNALIVYLEAEPEVILSRLKGTGNVRPLLEVSDPAGAVNDLLIARRPLYERSADIIVDTTGLTINNVVNNIIAELPENESVNLQK